MYPDADNMDYARRGMMQMLKTSGVYSGMVLEGMYRVPRHYFVSEALKYRSYEDLSLPIGSGQTISRPSVIGRMVQALGLTGTERVLEIGTGSGYQTAIIAGLAAGVVTLERIDVLYSRAKKVLHGLGYRNIECMHSHDFNSAAGTFDAVIVAAGADVLPEEIFSKINTGGRLIIPIGGSSHVIKKFVKKDVGAVIEEDIGEAVFVPYVRTAAVRG